MCAQVQSVTFEVCSADRALHETLVFEIYPYVDKRIRTFFLELVRGTAQHKFSYRGSPIYAATESFFLFGNIERAGVKCSVPLQDASYPFKVPRIGAGQPLPKAGYLCLIPADQTSSSQELLVTLANCQIHAKDMVCIGELAPTQLDALARIGQFLKAVMLRPQRPAFISNCYVQGEPPPKPCDAAIDSFQQATEASRVAEEAASEEWHKQFQAMIESQKTRT
ncbi:hypothetical protein GMRT_10021 [Giardia muris]|uniref:Uncharacterized protein n=1 Tax=Giardia muris TaxID=5742 RepID=A0A4Z1T6G2_GIAMU|nr:hypothetical protein GMRT_10021 [Giardia muris]|eukprot:TNJ28061.1 hypothetical protein GMRT_10021 [Giardia muris]